MNQETSQMSYETVEPWNFQTRRRYWWVRRRTVVLPTGARSWYSKFVGKGLEECDIFQMPDDARAWYSPDGNWNADPRPLWPHMTYNEACKHLNRQCVAPSLNYINIEGEMHVTFDIWRASDQDVFKAWTEGEANGEE